VKATPLSNVRVSLPSLEFGKHPHQCPKGLVVVKVQLSQINQVLFLLGGSLLPPWLDLDLAIQHIVAVDQH